MKLKPLLAIIFLISTIHLFGKTNLLGRTIVNGYYITLNDDTIKSKFLIKDLFALHKEIVCIDSLDNTKPLSPYDIKSFSFRVTQFINDSREIDEIDHSSDQVLINKGYLYNRKTFSLNAEINAAPFLGDSVENYKSIDIGNGKKLFLSIDNGKNALLQTAIFHTKIHVDKPYLTSSIWLLINGNQIIERRDRKVNEWVAETVNDYKTLSLWIKNKKIRAFPWDFKLVVNDYNNWLEDNKPDTTFYLKGLIDAQNNYKPVASFTISYITGTAFFLPGLITAVIVSHNPKEGKIYVAEKFALRNNANYIDGFQHRAYDKKYRAAAKGAILGGLTWIGLLILLT